MVTVGVFFAPLRASRDFIDYPYFADLGAVQAAAVLREHGFAVTVADALAAPGSTVCSVEPDEVVLGTPIDAYVDQLPEFDVAVVAFTPFHRPPHRAAELGRLLEVLRERAPEAPIVLADLYQSGQHVVRAAPSAVLAAYPEVDVWLELEAEHALPGLVEELAMRGRPPVAEARLGAELPSLDALPLPAWDLVDLAGYWSMHQRLVEALGRPHWAFPIGDRSLPQLTSRGCPYRCVHCSSNPGRARGQPKLQRRHGAEAMHRTFAALAALGAGRVHVLDELCNVNAAHFDALLGAAESARVALEIPNGVRADHLRADQIERLSRLISTLSVSAESGNQRVLSEVVGKDLELGSITRACASARDAGLPSLVHFIIGLPGETRAEINDTLEYAVDLFQETGAEPSVQFATPLPGTRLAELAEGSGLGPAPGDWGPRFQQQPSFSTADFDETHLLAFKRTFDARIAASRGPKKLILNATYRCNNRCTFCAVGTRTQVDGDLRRQCELLLKYRREGVTLLDIDGGEPTLNRDLRRLIRFARKVGYERVNVTTNGRMCSYADYAERLVSSGVTSVLFSIHGVDAKMHAQNVGVAEAFDETLAGVRNVVRLAPSTVEVGVNVTVTKSNHTHIEALCQLVFDLGARWLNIQFLTPFGRATRSVSPDTTVAAQLTMRAIDVWKDRLRFQVINLPMCFMPGYEQYLASDQLKLERNMAFVNNEEVNLFAYLEEQRRYEPQCAGCVHRVFCGGFYQLDDNPEPEWLIEPDEPGRPLAADAPVPRGAPMKHAEARSAPRRLPLL